jgi:hypothetical protein
LVVVAHEERGQGQLQEVDEGEASQDAQTSKSEGQLLAATDPGERTEPGRRLALTSLGNLI